MTIFIDNKSGVPIYDQICTQIREQIVSGALQTDEGLPSIRNLAKDLKVSVITTKRAYEELEREGGCQTQRGLGTFVTDSGETVQRLREEMARGAVSRFLADLKGIGMNREDAIELIRKEDNTDDHQ